MAPTAGSTMTTRSTKKANGAAQASGESKGEKAQDDFVPRDETEAKHREFFWTYTEEPHRTRRLAIIKAHPEVSACQLAQHRPQSPSRAPPRHESHC